MFHVLFIAPVLGLIAIYGAIALVVLWIPFGIGGLLQFIFTIVSRSRAVLCVPAVLGVLGAVVTLILLSQDLPVWSILLYWGLYFVWLWIIWLLVTQIAAFIRRKITGC